MNINAPLEGAAFAVPFTKAANPEKRHEFIAENNAAMRLPFIRRIPDGIRNHFIAMCGEYVGTVLFLYFALAGTQVANNIHTSSGASIQDVGSNPQQLQYIALCFGFSLAVNAWVFFRISGGLFNPAVTFGMCLIGALPWVRGCLLFFVQILGGMTAAALVSCMFPGPLTVRTSLGGGTSVVQGLFIEMFLTAELVFTIFMLAAEKHRGTFIAPVGIGLSLFIAELVGVYFTGGSLNPARSFGPAVVAHDFYSYHWIYWLGPILGSIVAAGFYKFIKMLEYETANPEQDSDHNPVLPKSESPHRRSLHSQPHAAHDPSGRLSPASSHTYGDFAERNERVLNHNHAHNAANYNYTQPQQQQQLAAVASPGMAPPSAAFAGLQEGGMHAGQGEAQGAASSSPAMVVGDSLLTNRRNGSYRRDNAV